MQPTPPRLFRFSSPVTRTKGEPGPHQLRDADTFALLMAVLLPERFNYGGLLFNYADRSVSPDVLLPSDTVVITTRPPLDDHLADVHKQSKRTNSPLEARVLRAIRPYFQVCARSQLVLAEPIAKSLSDRFADREVIELRIHGEATYRNLRRAGELRFHRPERDDLTPAFLIRTPMWPGGPTLLAVFGMSGTSGLVWAQILRTRCPELVLSDEPRFVMVEITLSTDSTRPLDLSFAERLPVSLLLDERLPLPGLGKSTNSAKRTIAT